MIALTPPCPQASIEEVNTLTAEKAAALADVRSLEASLAAVNAKLQVGVHQNYYHLIWNILNHCKCSHSFTIDPVKRRCSSCTDTAA